jgi:hypothetical protein
MASKGLDRAGWQEKLRLLGHALRERGCTLRLEARENLVYLDTIE